MNIPHKHAALIKAWADGAIIQILWNHPEEWKDCDEPTWLENSYYRIKPQVKTIKFRCFLQEGPTLRDGRKCPPRICTIRADQVYLTRPKFIQWLGDWQEYTIKEEKTQENCICRSVHNCNCK